MKRAVAMAFAVFVASALTGCAYKPLKAPCSPDEGGVALGFAAEAPRPELSQPFAPLDTCGPMKPI
jgi:hypothetical protein